MITCNGIATGGSVSRGKHQDARTRQALKKRKQARDTKQDAERFAKMVMETVK